jgi:PilZ domain
MVNTTESAIDRSAKAALLERRRYPRYECTADVEILDHESGIVTPLGRTADLSSGGCYVDTVNPLAPETVVKLRLTKWHQSFEAQAKTVYSRVGMGMGLMFVAVDSTEQATLESWIDELGHPQPGECDLPEPAEQSPRHTTTLFHNEVIEHSSTLVKEVTTSGDKESEKELLI